MDLRYTWGGEEFRVVVDGDVVALPYDHWAMAGFGSGISEEWLDHVGQLPGKTKARRRIQAYFVRRALADAHGYDLGAHRDSDGFTRRMSEGVRRTR